MHKRKLTTDEISFILDFLKLNKNIPHDTSVSIINNLKKRFESQLVNIEVYPAIIPELKQQIEEFYRKSLIQPGESVGIICAQSIGEKNTQSTLNSVDWLEKILYIKNNRAIVQPIGQMIDDLLLSNTDRIEKIEENRTEYLSLDDGYYIPSCDEDGKTGWFKIEAVTKHLPVGKLVKVMTQSGREITATQSKSFLTWDGKKFVATEGRDIKVGDILPTTKRLNTIQTMDKFDFQTIFTELELFTELDEADVMTLDHNFGFFVGIYLAVGIACDTYDTYVSISHNNETIIKGIKDWCDTLFESEIDGNVLKIHSILLARMLKITCSGKKHIPDFAYVANLDFVKGLIDGYFSGNGSISDDGSIIVSSAPLDLIHGISFLLSYFNVFGVISGNKGLFTLTLKEDDYYSSIRDVHFDRVISVDYVDGSTEYVYDLTVETTRNFQLFNGLNCRDTFHRAGQTEKSVVQGVPRFLELLNATKNPRVVNCRIFFNEGNKSIEELRNTINHKLVCLTLKDLAEKIDICLNKEPEEWYDTFKILYNDKFSSHTDCLSLKLNKKVLFKYRISLQDIAKVIEDKYDDLHCVFSSQSIGQLDIFVDMSNIKFNEKQLLFVTEENANEIYLEECVKVTLEKMVIFGIQGVTSIYFTHEKDEWLVETDGCNFRKLLGHPLIDMTRLETNNVWDIYENLGIEAARQFLIDELEKIMDGINQCHIKLLAEKMTFTGSISSISRYTLKKEESGPLSKASFEESVDHMIKSGFAGDVEKMKGVSASIICGKRSNIGTGMMNLKVDINKIVGTKPLVNNIVFEE